MSSNLAGSATRVQNAERMKADLLLVAAAAMRAACATLPHQTPCILEVRCQRDASAILHYLQICRTAGCSPYAVTRIIWLAGFENEKDAHLGSPFLAREGPFRGASIVR